MKKTLLAPIFVPILAPILALVISVLACFGICHQVSAAYTAGSTKLTLGDMSMKSRNNSLHWDPSNCTSFSLGSGCCNYQPTTNVWQDRLRELVEACGEYTMNLQVKYGLPWEIVYGQMVMESHVGTAYSQEQQDKNNYLGMKYAGSQYYSIADSAFGGSATMGAYETIGDMIASWNVDFLRNGLYDHAFSHLDPNNYSMKEFFYAYKETYCPTSDGCGPADSYWSGIQQGLDIVNEVAAKKSWPSSAQLAKQKNIPIGGEYPVKGDIHDQINAEPHSLHAECSASDALSSNNTLSSTISTSSSAKSDCTTYEGEYPEYIQGDQSSEWYNKPYAGDTIASSGCGPSSLAMLATVATGTDIYPHDIAAITNGSGAGNNYVLSIGPSMVALDKQVGLKYGFEVEEVTYNSLDDAINKMRQYLKDGYMLHLSGQGSDPFSMAGHYIGIFSIDNDDTVTIANSSHHGGNKMKLGDVVYAGMHGGAFSAIKGKGGSKCGGFCQAGAGDHSGGFKSVEEAEKVIIAPYQALRLTPDQWGKYHITAGTTENCFSFTNYFISKYLKIDDFIGVPGVDGGGLAQQFYNMYHGKYPDLAISHQPSAFAVASCGDTHYNGSNYSHTFVILGVDQANDKMIIGEAGYGMGASFTGAKEKSLTDASDAAYNGSGSISCTYVNVNKYITGL